MSIIGWLSSWVAGKTKRRSERLSEKAFIPSGVSETAMPKILLARLAGGKVDEVNKRLGDLLTGISGVEVFQRKETLKVPDGIENPVQQLAQASEEGRGWLKEEGADLLVWGNVDKTDDRLMLRLLPALGANGDQGDSSGVGVTLEIPKTFGNGLNVLIQAAVIGTVGPTFKGARARLGETLGGYLEQVGPLVQALPQGLSNAQAVSVLNAIGNVYVAYSHLGGGVEQLDQAATAYKEAEKRVSKDSQPLVWARVQNHLAAVLQAQGQMKKDAKQLRSAAVIHSNVAATLSATAHADDWGAAHINLGRVLYILAGLEGKPEYLKTAAENYEKALTVYDKNAAPGRWAEVTNQYGVVLLALGEEMGGDATLEQAVSKFRTAMKVHKRDQTPLLWAQTANNLGAACFALAKRNSENSLLREASSCFEGATEIYRQQGITKQAQVIEKNLHRVQRLLVTRGG